MSELKLCPFCGGEAVTDILDIQENEMFWRYSAGCRDIGCIAYCRSMTWFDTEQEAIEAWNTRTPEKCNVVMIANEDLYGGDYFACSRCWIDLSSAEDCDPDYLPNYCPGCGRKVDGSLIVDEMGEEKIIRCRD